MKKLYFILAMSAVQLSAMAQVHTVTGPKTYFNIPATGPTFTLVNLESGKVVPNSDSATTKWHVGFNKTKIILNSGKGGPGSVTGQVLSTDFMATDLLPTTGYRTEDTDALVIPIGSGNGWYNYNSSNNQITPIYNRSVALKIGNSYALLQLVDYYKDQDVTKAAATYSIRVQLSPTTDVSQKFTRVSNLYAGYSIRQFFNLATADTVPSADSTSLNWHMSFLTTTINVNSGSSGPGTTETQILSSLYNDVKVAPIAGYKADAAGEPAIATGSGNGWYTYDMVVHSISPTANKTIVTKDGMGHYTKMAIKSYYKDAPANPTFLDASTTKYYTMEYFFNPMITRDLNQDAVVTNGIIGTNADDVVFTIYPNPSNGTEVTISYPTTLKAAVVNVINLSGELVQQTALDSTGIVSIPTGNLTTGMYLIQLAGKSQRLIIQ